MQYTVCKFYSKSSQLEGDTLKQTVSIATQTDESRVEKRICRQEEIDEEPEEMTSDVPDNDNDSDFLPSSDGELTSDGNIESVRLVTLQYFFSNCIKI